MKFGPQNKRQTSNSQPAPPPSPPTSPTSPADVAAASSPAALDDVKTDLLTAEAAPDGDIEELEVGTAPQSKFSVMQGATAVDVDAVARRAVEQVLSDQAEAARYDVYENRVTITLDDEDLRNYKTAWAARNAQQPDKMTFSAYLATRLKSCRSHTASRPVYIDDTVRQYIEDLFSEMVTTGQDLANKIDRHIRPIIESPDLPDGILRFKPLDPTFVEMVTGWEPDKTAAEAIGDFMHEAAMQKAGLA
jgi:hypothetical protein